MKIILNEICYQKQTIPKKRTQEITNDKIPSIAQIRNAFNKMTQKEQKNVVNNIKYELNEIIKEKNLSI